MRFYLVSITLIFLCFLATLSYGTNPTHIISDISINCGSAGTFSAPNGKEWIGDKRPKLTSLLQIKGTSTTSTATRDVISGNPVIHKTARISHSEFFYSFHLNPGPKLLRFHFNPTPYKSFTRYKDLFTVEAGPYTLLGNFSATLTARDLGVSTFTKEFYVNIGENRKLDLIFSPTSGSSQDRTYAFINGIEIISVPTHLSYFRDGDFGAQVVGRKSLVYVDNNTALEVTHRSSVNRDPVSSDDECDVWTTVAKQKANANKNLTWERSVNIGFRYLVRIHFSELGLKTAETAHLMFKVHINKMMVDTSSDIVGERDEEGGLWYRDYLVVMKGHKQDSQQNLSITLQLNSEVKNGHGLLQGFEILKLSNPDNSLSSPNPLPPPESTPSWFIRNFLPTNDYKPAIATVAITLIALINIIAHVVRQLCEANFNEENMPSAKAKRVCRRFSLAEIKSATSNFSHALLIGGGGFGKVYKGLIDNGQQTVAIKQLKSYSKQGKHEFLTEIETLSELRHINLVALIGYCSESREMILVYEYMTCGTLADHLYKLGRDNSNYSPLTWKQRLNICIGAARGLDYLHTGHRVIHRDVKASNILLDEDFTAKVSDFGLAKYEDRTKLQSHESTNVKGTFGYFDPYYFSTRKLTRKSDTYAFGVVLFQVLCERPAVGREIGEYGRYLTDWARNRISMGELKEIVASSLIGEIGPDSLKVFVGVAESCLHDEPKKRPTMAQVVVQLELALEQQERRNFSTSNQETRVAAEIGQSNVGTEQAVSTYVQNVTNSKRVKTEPSAGHKDERNIEKYKPLRLWPWDALMNRVKPSKKKETIKILSEIRQAETKQQKFDFRCIADATNQFSTASRIGQGGFGSVYKAVLPTGQTFAVKKLSTLSSYGLNEFKTEIMLLSQLQHRNIIKLLGYCMHGEEVMLVYEFMENRSLDTYIFDETKRCLLQWALRFKIIMGIASGIMYLNQDSGMRIIHRDIKTSNILLDSHMNPKISDFGLATTCEDDQSEVDFEVIAGTLGYMAPEFLLHGKASFMSDIYSFGVVILEMLSGKKIAGYGYPTPDFNLIEYTWKLWDEGRPLDLVDESMQGSMLEEEVVRCIQVGLLCTQEQSSHRPTMPSVLKMLSGEELSLDLHGRIALASRTTHDTNFTDERMPHQVVNSTETFQYDSTMLSEITPQKSEEIKWKKPEVGWCKLNTDGRFIAHTGKGSGGGLVRNDHGHWITGFSCKFGNCTAITEAQLLALREGLKQAWERRVEKIVVEIDSKVIVTLIKSRNTTSHPLGAIIADCLALIGRPWICELQYADKEGNKCARALAKKFNETENLKLVWDSPPKGLMSLLEDDVT